MTTVVSYTGALVRLACRLGLALSIAVRLAGAQRPASSAAPYANARPIAPAPDSAPVVRKTIPREPTPSAINGLPRHLPIVLRFDRYTVIASTTWSHGAAVRTSASDAAFLRCAATLRVQPDTARSLLAVEPWREFDAAAADAPYILFQVMPLDTPLVECGRMQPDAVRYLQRGALFVRPGTSASGIDISHVDVLIDSSFAPPMIYGRAPAAVAGSFVMSSPSGRRPSPHQVRAYVPMDALDPTSGLFHDVTLQVWSDSLQLVGVPVRHALTNVLWHELVPWRIDRRRDTASIASTDVPAVPTPQDAVLQGAVARYRRGAIIDAAEQAAAWRAVDLARSGGVDSAGSGGLRRDRLIADVIVGGVLAAQGDTTAVRPFVRDALASAPCLVTTAAAASTYARILTSTRPDVRCVSLPRSAIVRRGLVFPGGGHSVAGDRGRAITTAAIVAGAFAAAGVATWSASQRYDKYKQAMSVARAQTLYDDATTMRTIGRAFVIGGAAAWLGDIGYALLRERRRSARIRDEQTFGTRSR